MAKKGSCSWPVACIIWHLFILCGVVAKAGFSDLKVWVRAPQRETHYTFKKGIKTQTKWLLARKKENKKNNRFPRKYLLCNKEYIKPYKNVLWQQIHYLFKQRLLVSNHYMQLLNYPYPSASEWGDSFGLICFPLSMANIDLHS